LVNLPTASAGAILNIKGSQFSVYRDVIKKAKCMISIPSYISKKRFRYYI